jgi:hypothetical protein
MTTKRDFIVGVAATLISQALTTAGVASLYFSAWAMDREKFWHHLSLVRLNCGRYREFVDGLPGRLIESERDWFAEINNYEYVSDIEIWTLPHSVDM